MEHKYLFFDVDETLYSNKTGQIPPSAGEALKRAQANGHKIFLNTGRPYAYVGTDFFSLNFDGYLCGNGTDLRYRGDILYHRELPEQIQRAIIDLCSTYSIRASLEGSRCSYFTDDDTSFHPYYASMIEVCKSSEGMVIEFSWDHVESFDKLVCFSSPDAPQNMAAFIEQIKSLDFPLKCIRNDDSFYEIIPEGTSKGTAITYIAEYFNIPKDDCYAFGDAPNDLPMFEAAGHGIALGNAYDCVKDVAEYVTTDIDAHGIRNALDHYGFL